MSTTFQLDTATSRATPTPQPMKRLTVPKLRARKADGMTQEPIVMLTAYTARQAQLLLFQTNHLIRYHKFLSMPDFLVLMQLSSHFNY